MKDLSFDLLTPSYFYVNLWHFSKKRGLTRILQQKKSQWWSYRLNYHKNHLFPGTPTNIRIIEITPSLQARDSGNRLCAHLLLFEKRIILWKAHVFIAWYSPWHWFLCLFLDFSAENENKDVPIRGYFGFSHALHLLLVVFRIHFCCGEINYLISEKIVNGEVAGRTTIETRTFQSPPPTYE